MSRPREQAQLPRLASGRVKEQASLPRLAYRVGEAAQVLGMSEDSFSRYVAPRLKWSRFGAVKLVSLRELEAFLERTSAHTLDDGEAA
jgi:hypothetical protein